MRSGTYSLSHYNSRGDVTAKLTASGTSPYTQTYQASYEAFGKQTQTVGTTPDRQKANTKEEDPTGLLNEGHRYRDLETGTFLTRDPAGFIDGPNLYAYVVQNPWTKFDPEGLNALALTPFIELAGGAALGSNPVGWAFLGLSAVYAGGATLEAAITPPATSPGLYSGGYTTTTESARSIVVSGAETGPPGHGSTDPVVAEGESIAISDVQGPTILPGGSSNPQVPENEGIAAQPQQPLDLTNPVPGQMLPDVMGMGGESAAAADGRRAHKNYGTALGEGWDTRVVLPSGRKPDAVHWKNREVRELKPDNSRATNRGQKQVERYRQELESVTHQKWTSEVDTYKSKPKEK